MRTFIAFYEDNGDVIKLTSSTRNGTSQLQGYLKCHVNFTACAYQCPRLTGYIALLVRNILLVGGGVDVLSLSRRGWFWGCLSSCNCADVTGALSFAVRNWFCDFRPQLWIRGTEFKALGVGMLARNLRLVYHALVLVNRMHSRSASRSGEVGVQVTQKVRVVTFHERKGLTFLLL
jgi:hypothetical protein